MQNQTISKASQSTQDPFDLITPSLHLAMTRALNSEGNGKIPAYAALSQAQRGQLENALAEIRRFLTPAAPEQIRVDLLTLFTAYPKREDDESAAVKLALYTAALAEYPAWAIRRAIQARLMGKDGNPVWLPTPAELARYSASLCVGYHTIIARIENVLRMEAEPARDDAARARVLEGFKQLRRDLAGGELQERAGR